MDFHREQYRFVQPAMERDWKTDPFDMASIDGYLYGRGTSDNKVRFFSSAMLEADLAHVDTQPPCWFAKAVMRRPICGVVLVCQSCHDIFASY